MSCHTGIQERQDITVYEQADAMLCKQKCNACLPDSLTAYIPNIIKEKCEMKQTLGPEHARWQAELKKLDGNLCPVCGNKMLYSTEHYSWRNCRKCNKTYRRDAERFVEVKEL